MEDFGHSLLNVEQSGDGEGGRELLERSNLLCFQMKAEASSF